MDRLNPAADRWLVIRYIGRMPAEALQIIRCPTRRMTEALSLVLCDLTPNERKDVATHLVAVEDSADLANEALYVAMRGDELRGAAWGQRQSGNLAMFWPPQLTGGENQETGGQLAQAVVNALDETAIEMCQVLLPTADLSAEPVLTSVGFDHLANLLYLSCEAEHFPDTRPDLELDFVTFRGADRARLARLIERTYDQTLDCVKLNGMRTTDEVITGYQGTGRFNPENWLIAQHDGRDVGVLLVSEHPPAKHWELMYMGLSPESRGLGWGSQITEHAKWRAARAGIERIVLAVDAVNTPALRMYLSAGFETWDRRTVYVRFPAKPPA